MEQKIKDLSTETEKQKKELEDEKNSFIAESNGNHAVQKNIADRKRKLVEYHFREKELNALYKTENSKSIGILAYYINELKNYSGSFCEDIFDEDKVKEKLRMLSIRYICSNTFSLEDMFNQYKKIIEHLNTLIEDTPYNTLYKLFYYIKFEPYASKIQLGYLPRFKPEDCEENRRLLAKLEEELNKHPLNPQNLTCCFNNDIIKYHQILEEFYKDSIAQIREMISISSVIAGLAISYLFNSTNK